MQEEPEIVQAGTAGSAAAMNTLMREMRGSFFQSVDPRFFIIVFLSVGIHIGGIYYFHQVKLPPPASMDIEKVPERFARLIIEKPLPKVPVKPKKQTAATGEQSGKPTTAAAEKTDAGATGKPQITKAERSQAQRVVAARTRRVEQMVRSVGVLGMLTGVGATAKGPAVVDVLGAMGNRKESSGNLDDALSKMSGLRKAEGAEVLQSKLVKSKDVAIEHKQEIDDLVASVGNAKSVDLAKRGEFVIQKPESIEGSASSNAKRDNNAITAVVTSRKASLRMSYEKYLKRNPSLSGKITIRFTITASGAVSAITILENSTGSPELEQEITNKIRLWQFETIDEGDVTVTYPFVFMPAS